MEIIPAIDIMNGKCVRLTRGDYATKKIYAEDPVVIAQDFENSGIKRLHLVDLDGARAKRVVNIDVLKKIAGKTNLAIDFGGGIQSDEDIENVFTAGATMVTAGSVVVKNRALYDQWIKKYGGEKIILGADVIGGKIAVAGWKEKTEILILNYLEEMQKTGIQYVICTDIGKDGMLQGPALGLYSELISQFNEINFIASGGVSGIEDINNLHEAGLWGVIIGKALYEGKIKLSDLKSFIN